MRYKEAIKKYKLDSKSRKRENVWRRAIISHELEKKGFTMQEIGRLFNRDHSTVVNAKKVYQACSLYKDFQRFRFRFMQEMTEVSVEDKLKMCETFEDFKQLKESL